MEHKEMDSSDKYSLGNKVFQILREDILEKRYKKNDELKEMSIAKAFGVSRTPVREAFRQLELEGLINIIPNKGACVVGFSNKDIRDIYEIRSLLEGLCARWATQSITENQLEILEEILDLMEFHVSKGRLEKTYDLDNKFHDFLYSIAGSRILNQTLSDYHHYVHTLRKKTLCTGDRVKRTIEEHRGIVDAMRQKDEQKADRLANEHIHSSFANIENQHLLNN